MPLVRISLMKGKPEEFGQKVGEIVYQAMVDTINVPVKDHFQIITDHDSNTLIYDPTYLDIQRTHGIIVIQITLNEGRTVELKKLLYQIIAERLHRELDVRREDVFINLVEVKKENWSFGNGIAQYA
jgi:phenylpyruvate tautomerase PptA (4-oxalocrotonate tautomerase family)